MFGPTWMFHDGWAGGGFDEAAMRDAVAINRLVSGADAALGIGSPTRSRIAMLTVDISGLWDQEVRRAGRRTIVDENRAIYWALRLEGHQVDFVTDEDVARGVLASRDYAILYITSPCLSKAAQACVRSFVNIGGSLVLGLEAASSDEANDMSVNLGDLTGSTRCSPAQVGPFALHLAEGMLDPTLPPSGKFDHGLVVGPVGPLIPTATGVTTVALCVARRIRWRRSNHHAHPNRHVGSSLGVWVLRRPRARALDDHLRWSRTLLLSRPLRRRHPRVREHARGDRWSEARVDRPSRR